MVIPMLLFVMATGCSGQYKGMPREEVLAYQTHATYGGLHSLAVAYAESINAAIKEDTLHPGMYADYGVTLALMGHRSTACRMLNAEVRAFPESRGMVRRIKQQLLPEMMEDTLAPLRDTADIAQLMSWAYDSLTALRPLPVTVPPVIDSTDTAWLRKQTPIDSIPYEIRLTANQKREMLAEQQTAAERARKAYADSVAAAKQAKIDARQQAKAEKEKAKKQNEKDKKKAAKQKQKLEKQKQKERQQAASEKKKEQERKAAEKKKEQQMKAAERQREQQQKAAAKKQADKEKKELEKQKQKEQQQKAAAKKQADKEKKELEKQRQKEQQQKAAAKKQADKEKAKMKNGKGGAE